MSALWAEDVPLLDLLEEPDEEAWASPFAEDHEVIGTDTRQHVADPRVVPHRWVCSLDVTFNKPYPKGWTSGFARGSGLLVGPRHVLTAAHNLFPDGKTGPATVYAAPGRNGDDDPFGRVKVARIFLLKAALTGTNVPQIHDYAIVKLEKDIGYESFKTIGGQTLGYWGSEKLGHNTKLKPLSLTFLTGKNIAVTGYPGDRCGTKPCNPASCNCSKQDQASTQWSGLGLVNAAVPKSTRRFFHTADTAQGQSGSPVWMRFSNGERWVVGVHLAPHGATAPYTHNVAVHLSSSVIANLNAWMNK